MTTPAAHASVPESSRPTSWDTEPQLWARTTGLRARFRFGRRIAIARCLARTAPFESAAAALRDPAEAPPPIAALAGDLRARRAAVEIWSLSHSALMLQVGGTWKLVLAAVVTTFIVTWLGVWALVVFAAAVAPIVIAVPLEARRAARRLRLTRSLRERTCCDCGYALTGTPDGLPGTTAGPRACPECGAPWPLVPPPV